jgi:PAS domain S-box-containing protein
MQETGRLTNSVAIDRDAKKRKGGEHALWEAQPILQSVLDALPACVAILDEAGQIVAVNVAWRGCAEADPSAGPAGTVGANYLELCRADSGRASPVAAVLAKAIQEIVAGERCDFSLEYACGPQADSRWLAVRISPFAAPRPAWLVIAFEEVTQRKIVEEELRLRDRAMAASGEGIVITDPQKPNNPIVYVNTGFERITGYPRDAAIGQSCRFLQGADTNPDALAEIRAALREQRECQVELLNYRQDGSPFWNRLSITPVRDESGKLSHYVGVQSDITPRKRAEDELKKANQELERAHAEVTAASARMRRDLAAAARVQRALLPAALPELPGVRFAWTYKPCDELAGDILNVTRLDDRHVGLYLLDVSGHGMAAALLSVTVSHILSKVPDLSLALGQEGNGAASPHPVPPARVAAELNKRFRWDPIAAQYFTLLYGVLNGATGEFRYVAAGHPGPVRVPQDGVPVILEAPTGLPIGILESDYREVSVRLQPGDRLYLYSDGITDRMNEDGELFGQEQLIELLGEGRAAPLEASLEGVVRNVEGWGCRTCLKDDISILAVEMLPA